MTLALEAQRLGERGFRVHPLKSKDQPYTKYSQTATYDPAAIAAWWMLFPRALIAVATGSGLVVVDDDRRNGLDAQLAADCALIATTPKGGFHYYFHCATPVRNSTSKLAPGVDVRGEGGYVVAPPSEGRAWHKDSGGELTTLPGVLLAACMRSEPAAGTFEPRQHVPAGERHDYLVRAAGWMLANEIADDLESLLAEVMAHASQVCAPWPASEMARVWTHVRGICKWVIAREDGAR